MKLSQILSMTFLSEEKMYQYPFLDFNKMNELFNDQELKSSQKIAAMYESMGGEFYDPEKTIMKGSQVGIVSIGGLPVEVGSDGSLNLLGNPVSLETLREHLYRSVGMSSYMSYLNPKGKMLEDVGRTTLELQHYSVLHMINISVLLVGISIGVEHEFSSQRDIVHLSRVTVAKTKAQESPCLILRNPDYYEAYKEILEKTKEVLNKFENNDMETRNLLFPSAKASAVILTGSLKNMLKLVSLKDAGGKEDEFVDALNKIDDVLKFVFKDFI